MNVEERWERGTDRAYNELLESGDRETLEREALEAEILTDDETFERVATEYVKSTKDSPMYGFFLAWAVDFLQRERTPEHDHAWENRRD